LRLYTIDSAYTQFAEEETGSIEVGKLADLVVLSEDILTVPEENIRDIEAQMTLLDGGIVYERE
jgi:predicted amidohydrolase YtcJ